MTLEPLGLVISPHVGGKVLMREFREVGGREGLRCKLWMSRCTWTHTL